MNEKDNQKQETVYKAMTVGSFLLVFVGILIVISFLLPNREEENISEPSIDLPSVFEDVELEADAAIVYDLKTGETLFDIAGESQLPLASLTKLLSTYTAIVELGENKHIQIEAEDLAVEGDSGLLLSETWTVGDLARFTLISSSNDGANALTRAASAHKGKTPATLLSQTALALALPQTFALNGTGLDATQYMSGAYGSAKDIALLLGSIHEHRRPLLLDSRHSAAAFSSLEGFSHVPLNTNELAGRIPNLVGAKTGYTDLAGGNLAVLIEVAPKHPVAVVVLGSTRDGRFSDVKMLVDRTLQHFTYSPVL